MSYSAKKGLPTEKASFIAVGDMFKHISSSNLYDNLKLANIKNEKMKFLDIWEDLKSTNINQLEKVIVVDGGINIASKNNIKVAFIQVGMLYLNMPKIENLSYNDYCKYFNFSKNNHKSQIIIPLSGFYEENEGNFGMLRELLYKSLPSHLNETLKWLLYKKWDTSLVSDSPNFHCPCCEKKIYLEFNREFSKCEFCFENVYLTDVLSLHLAMQTGSKKETVAMSYMGVLEILMLFNSIRERIESDVDISEYLFLKDGPMLCGQQLAKIVMRIREFISYTQKLKKLIHIVSVEKNGTLVDYLERNEKFLSLEKNEAKFAVLTHGFIRDNIQCASKRKGYYGERSNWGEKVLLKNEYGAYVLNIPVRKYVKSHQRPFKEDFIGLIRILYTMKSITSIAAGNALYPIVKINQEVSLPAKESDKLLDAFLREIHD